MDIIKPIELTNHNSKIIGHNKIKKKAKSKKKKKLEDLITANNAKQSFNNSKSKSMIQMQAKEEQELIKELKEKDNLDYYIFYVIKNIESKKRKNYLSQSEMQSLSYENALQIEDRKRGDYYFALLKEKNKVISIFLNDEDYNIKSIKLSTFIFDFSLSLTINALFYNDEAIYQINQEIKDSSLTSQYSRIIYSSIISGFLNFIIELLAFSQKSIIKLRFYKNIKDTEKEIPKLIKKLKAKVIIYYIMTILLSLIFFYYITAFCAIYTIIQTHMISDSSISFLLTMSYNLILSLISSMIRIFSLQKKNKFRRCLYFISWIISLI